MSEMGLGMVVTSLLYFVALQMVMQKQGCIGCSEKERMGLLEIKAHFVAQGGSAKSELASWVDDRTSNCCTWKRVKCSNISAGHVTRLSLRLLLSDFDETSELNVSLFRPFEELLSLDLYGNNFHGSWIDHEDYQNLKKLEVLNLRYNSLDGSLQDLQNLESLKVLDLSQNRLNGSIQGLCQMKNLVELDLSDNMLSGQLPECLSILTNLQVLDLSNNRFSGKFPSFTSNLTSLAYLSLYGNYMQGSFSLSTLANHSKLQVLYISSSNPRAQVATEKTQWLPTFQLKSLILRSCNLNKDEGSNFPSFLLYQHDLQFIDLSHNKIVGAFPSWLIQNNSRLEFFSMRNNSFVGNLQLYSIRKDLFYMDISENNIGGSLPKDFGIFFPNMTYLNMSMNNFEGNIPASIGEMNSIWYMDLSHNHFSGEFPKQLATGCVNLQYLKLSNNYLKGNVPKYSNWRDMIELYLSNNNFNGTIEDVFANNTRLEVIDASNNSISGAIPSSIGKFSSVRILFMAENQLEGEIPFELSKLTQLEMLDLSQNKLSGSIPYFNLLSLRFLYLQKNALSGSIPFTLSESSQLVTLDLRNNKFSGNIPYWMEKFSQLRVLLLGGNNFEGNIPIQLCQLKNVSIMDLSHNMINGSIPYCLTNLSFGMEGYEYDNRFQVSNLNMGSYYLERSFINSTMVLYMPTNYLLEQEVVVAVEFRTKSNYYSYGGNILENMTGLDLSCNQLTGAIPFQIGNLQQIRALNLSHNYLSDSIPSSFSNLNKIESLDLSSNNLSGEIPSQLTQLNFLSIFNVSYNNLSGIPPSAGQFGNFDEENYKGNPGLCGPLLKRKCEGAAASPPSQANNTGGKEAAMDMVAFYWSFTASYITILLGFTLVLYIDAQWRLAWSYFIDKVILRCFPTFPLY